MNTTHDTQSDHKSNPPKESKQFVNVCLFLDIIRMVSPSIQALRNQTFVIGVPSKTILGPDLIALTEAIAFLRALNSRLVIVYSESETSELFEINDYLEPVAHERMASILARDAKIRHTLESGILKQHAQTGSGRDNPRIVSENFLEARPAGVLNGIDLKARGSVHSIRIAALQEAATNGNIVLLSTIAYSSTGDAHAVSLMEVVRATSAAIEASRAFIVVPARHSRISASLNSSENVFTNNARNKILPGKTKTVEAVSADGPASLLHVLLACQSPLEIWDQADTIQIRPAKEDDIEAIVALIDMYAGDGTMVRKNASMVREQLVHYIIAEQFDSVVACASLKPYASQKTAELASFAVAKPSRACGIGDLILEKLLAMAHLHGLHSVFALTTRTEQWFRLRGFVEMPADWLPVDRLYYYDKSRGSKIFCRVL